MQTVLPTEIKTVNQAKAFLAALYFNGESYHPEDDAHTIVWDNCEEPTDEEKSHLNKLIDDIYNLSEVMATPATFEPCEFLNSLDPQQVLNMMRDELEYIILREDSNKTDRQILNEIIVYLKSSIVLDHKVNHIG